MNSKLKIQTSKSIRQSKAFFVSLTTLLVFTLCSALALHAHQPQQQQRRDYLTEQEADLVREAQELDLRIGVFIKAIERRFLVIDGREADLKDVEKWGQPKGAKAQLLYDVSKILQSAIDNIDDVAARDAKNKLIPKAVHSLADAGRRFQTLLEVHKSRATDNKMEQAAILTSLDYIQQIIEASTKVPREAPKEEKKKKN
jgi:hypothetical protein